MSRRRTRSSVPPCPPARARLPDAPQGSSWPLLGRRRSFSQAQVAQWQSGKASDLAHIETTRSRLPPPRSPRTPSAPGVPFSRPTAASRASSAPERTCTGSPHTRSTRATKAGPSPASRTAAVATNCRRSTPIADARRTKRARLRNASSMPFGLSRPLRPSPEPKAHCAFSLKMGIGSRVGTS